MAVFIHGWQSSSEKYTERMSLFRDRGLHTLAIDSRGHGMAPDTPEWTAGKVILDVNAYWTVLMSQESTRSILRAQSWWFHRNRNASFETFRMVEG